MSSLKFPYRPLLQELTGVVANEGLDPYEAYAWLSEQQASSVLHPDTYCSTSITSGGHARDDSLHLMQVIERNTRSAMLLADQLAIDGQLSPTATIEPVSVGKTGWNQAEYMEFWFSVLGGYEVRPNFMANDTDNLRTISQHSFTEADLDIELMISSADPHIRAREYFKMSSAFARLIKAGANATPMSKLIRMIDTDLSLGAQTERAFARQLGVRVMDIAVIRPASHVDLLSVNHVLADDTARLISFGATVFDTQNNNVRLLLADEVVSIS